MKITVDELDDMAKGLAVKVWYMSREIWTATAGLILTVAPVIMDNIGFIGLTPMQLIAWSLGVQIVAYIATIYMRRTSRSVIVSGATLREAKETVAATDPMQATDGAPSQ